MGGRLLLLRRPFWQAFYFPMQELEECVILLQIRGLR